MKNSDRPVIRGKDAKGLKPGSGTGAQTRGQQRVRRQEVQGSLEPKVLSFKAPGELVQSVEAAAKAENKSVSEWLREVVVQHLLGGDRPVQDVPKAPGKTVPQAAQEAAQQDLLTARLTDLERSVNSIEKGQQDVVSGQKQINSTLLKIVQAIRGE